MEERFGPYRLLRRLAKGGMAEVYLAVQTGIEGFERPVVIKRILPHRARDEELCTMFLDEARLVGRLSHPHIAQLYDLGRVGDSYYIAMEHVRGLDLARLLDIGASQGTPALPDIIAVPVISALCEALHYIHTRTDELGNPLNIVHRDLTPKNVVLSFEGAVKLIDFGIAKAATHVHETQAGAVKGTYGYMAPEQVTRDHAIDARTDLFALGVLTYELTTGRHPFEAPDEVAVLTRLLKGEFLPPTRLVEDYPKELEALVLSLMALEPARRPASARDVLARLERFALARRLPFSMSRIADFVRLHAEGGEMDRGAPPALADREAAEASRRLAARADTGTAELATALLRNRRPASGDSRGAPGGPAEGSHASGGAKAVSRRRRAPASWGRGARYAVGAAAALVVLAALIMAALVVLARARG